MIYHRCKFALRLTLGLICTLSPIWFFGQKTPWPLTEEQAKKAVEACTKIAALVLKEPRGVNRQGGLNTLIKGAVFNLQDQAAPRSSSAHSDGHSHKGTGVANADPGRSGSSK
jgi:hypothetical protein